MHAPFPSELAVVLDHHVSLAHAMITSELELRSVMGNEMGNNNVTGQQAQGFAKTTIDHLDDSPSLNGTDGKGNDGTKDLDKLKDPIIPKAGDEQMVSDQKNASIKNKDLDDKNSDSLQDHSLTQNDDQSIKLPTTQGVEPLNNGETETVTDLTETTVTVSSTIEHITSNKDSSTSDEKTKLVHEAKGRCEESTIGNSQSLSKENVEGPLEDEESCNHASEAVDLTGEYMVENLEQGQSGVSTVENSLMPMQGVPTSSTETIITDYIDADDSDIKEVVMEDEPIGRGHSSYVRPADDTNLKTSKNGRAGILEEKEGICEVSQRAIVETVIGSYKVIDEDKIINGVKNQDEDPCGALDIGEVVSKFQSSLNKSEGTVAGEILDSVTGTEEHNVIERTHTEQKRADAAKNLADNSNNEEESGCVHDVVNLVEIKGKDFTCLDSSLSCHLPIVNEEKMQTEVRDGSLTSLSPLQLMEDFHQRDLKVNNIFSNEGASTSTYEVKTTDTQDTLAASQHDKQMLLEELEVVKFENSGILSSCMQFVEDSSNTSIIFPHGSYQEKDSASATPIGSTFECNPERVTVQVGFPAKSDQKEFIVNTEKVAGQEEYLQKSPAPGRDASDETPLLQTLGNMSSFSYSDEHHSKVVECIPMTNISLVQVKDDAEEEYEKSPLLSPREPAGRNFIVPNQSVRSKKPLQSLMTGESFGTWSPLKDQEPVLSNSTMVSSPRNKGKQKPRSSIFASCMCCTTATN
ncbi:hypothetical protein GUJ93_ZPchr0001g29482 [Zizania palustris]|uniref:Uncharacterized protein n=1 Tax=Zizania palustris TaxID=103762 RepID=A0A8J5RKB4_ZIZPA|nr:hypothetical protein GUJ93_ZPchr0001g29482 [Zizania palustris]